MAILWSVLILLNRRAAPGYDHRRDMAAKTGDFPLASDLQAPGFATWPGIQTLSSTNETVTAGTSAPIEDYHGVVSTVPSNPNLSTHQEDGLG